MQNSIFQARCSVSTYIFGCWKQPLPTSNRGTSHGGDEEYHSPLVRDLTAWHIWKIEERLRVLSSHSKL